MKFMTSACSQFPFLSYDLLLQLFQVFVSKVLSNCTDFLVLVIVGLSKSPLLV